MPSPSPPPSPQPLPKNFHGYAAIKNYFVGLNIFFIVLNWHYHIHPILNGQQNKTTNKIELQHIIDLYHESNIATMHCTVPLAALHDGNFLWKNSWKKHLQMYLRGYIDIFMWTVPLFNLQCVWEAFYCTPIAKFLKEGFPCKQKEIFFRKSLLNEELMNSRKVRCL